MPGHNHYSDCRCGWCFKGPGDPRFNLDTGLRAIESPTQLRDSFLDQNAKCPVCGAKVYYFENSYGSRVFFDDVGAPWPKHPCTDTNILNAPNSKGLSGSKLQLPTVTLLFNTSRLRFAARDPSVSEVREVYFIIETRSLSDNLVLVKARSLSRKAQKGAFTHFSIGGTKKIIRPNVTFAVEKSEALFIYDDTLCLLRFSSKRIGSREYHTLNRPKR